MKAGCAFRPRLKLEALEPRWCPAKTTTWTGAVSPDWLDPANWSNGVPAAPDTARLGGCTFDPEIPGLVAPGGDPYDCQVEMLVFLAGFAAHTLATDASAHVTVGSGGVIHQYGTLSLASSTWLSTAGEYDLWGGANIAAAGSGADVFLDGSAMVKLGTGTSTCTADLQVGGAPGGGGSPGTLSIEDGVLSLDDGAAVWLFDDSALYFAGPKNSGRGNLESNYPDEADVYVYGTGALVERVVSASGVAEATAPLCEPILHFSAGTLCHVGAEAGITLGEHDEMAVFAAASFSGATLRVDQKGYFGTDGQVIDAGEDSFVRLEGTLHGDVYVGASDVLVASPDARAAGDLEVGDSSTLSFNALADGLAVGGDFSFVSSFLYVKVNKGLAGYSGNQITVQGNTVVDGSELDVTVTGTPGGAWTFLATGTKTNDNGNTAAVTGFGVTVHGWGVAPTVATTAAPSWTMTW